MAESTVDPIGTTSTCGANWANLSATVNARENRNHSRSVGNSQHNRTYALYRRQVRLLGRNDEKVTLIWVAIEGSVLTDNPQGPG